MKQEWYVLQVLTGAELEVQQRLREQDIDTIVLREAALIRRGGRWQEEIRSLLPGYVFVYMQYTSDLFHKIRHTPAVIRFLPPDRPMPLTQRDCAWLYLFAGNGLLPPSRVDVRGETPVVLDGPLLNLRDYVVRFDRHRRKALLTVPILGEPKHLALSILPVTDGALPYPPQGM